MVEADGGRVGRKPMLVGRGYASSRGWVVAVGHNAPASHFGFIRQSLTVVPFGVNGATLACFV